MPARILHRALLRLLHLLPPAVLAAGIWAVVHLELVQLDEQLIDIFVGAYDAFSELLWTFLFALAVTGIVVQVLEIRRQRRLTRTLHRWREEARGALPWSDPRTTTRGERIARVRGGRWRWLLLIQSFRALLLSGLLLGVLALGVWALQRFAASQGTERAGHIGSLVIYGPLAAAGLILLAVWYFNKRAGWHTLLGALGHVLLDVGVSFHGEKMCNAGFLRWMDRYWSDRWHRGYAWHGIGVALVLDHFPVYVYADQRSKRRLDVLVAAWLPSSDGADGDGVSRSSEKKAKVIAEAREAVEREGHTVQQTPGGLLVTTAAGDVDNLLYVIERHGERAAAEDLFERLQKIVRLARALGGEPAPAFG